MTHPPNPPADSRGWPLAIALYALLGGVVCFAWLGSTDVVSMEGIVADGARHMQRTGDMLVPHLFNEMYAYKPALVYWLAYCSFGLFGESEWTLRLPIASCAFLLGLSVLLLLGRLLGPMRAALCGVAAISGFIFIQKTRIAEFDAPLALGVGVATCCALRVLLTDRGGWWLWPLGYVALAQAALAKGIPAVMVYGPGLLAAAIVLGKFRALLRLSHLVGVAAFVLPVGWYVLSVYQQAGLDAFRQAFSEAGARSSQWTPLALAITLAKPAIIAVIFLPWSPMFIFAADRQWRAALDTPTLSLLNGAIAFLLAGVVAFMLVPSFETRYYVPLGTSLGIIAGIVVTERSILPERWAKLRDLAARLTCGGLGAGAAAAAVIGSIAMLRKSNSGHSVEALAALGIAAATAIVLALRGGARLQVRPASSMMIAAMLCAWGYQALYNAPDRAVDRSLRPVAAAFAGHAPPREPIWVDFDDDHSSLVYYMRCDARWFRRRDGWPPPGSLLITYKDRRIDQLAELNAARPAAVEQLAQGTVRDWTFTLCRLRERTNAAASAPSSKP